MLCVLVCGSLESLLRTILTIFLVIRYQIFEQTLNNKRCNYSSCEWNKWIIMRWRHSKGKEVNFSNKDDDDDESRNEVGEEFFQISHP